MWDVSQGMVKGLGSFRSMQQDQAQPKCWGSNLGSTSSGKESCQPQAPDSSLQGGLYWAHYTHNLVHSPSWVHSKFCTSISIISRGRGVSGYFSPLTISTLSSISFSRKPARKGHRSLNRESSLLHYRVSLLLSQDQGIPRRCDKIKWYTRAIIPVHRHSHQGINTSSLLPQRRCCLFWSHGTHSHMGSSQPWHKWPPWPPLLGQWVGHRESSGSPALPNNAKYCHHSGHRHCGGESAELPGHISTGQWESQALLLGF